MQNKLENTLNLKKDNLLYDKITDLCINCNEPGKIIAKVTIGKKSGNLCLKCFPVTIPGFHWTNVIAIAVLNNFYIHQYFKIFADLRLSSFAHIGTSYILFLIGFETF